jgi:ribosomal-protein-alanine N-acetyltransferase
VANDEGDAQGRAAAAVSDAAVRVVELIAETPRLQVRPLGWDDAEALHACFGDVEAMRYWDTEPSRDVAQTVERIDRYSKADPRWQAAWAVVLKKSGAVIGFLNYHHRAPWDRRLEIGYILAPAYWRQGLMSDALRAFVGLCFKELDTHRIEAMIEPDNIASVRLASIALL